MTSDWSYPVYLGSDTTIPIPVNGDIVDSLLLRITLPITSNINSSFGTAMIKFIELQYDAQVIERIYGENIFIKNELMVPDGKRAALAALTSTPPTYYTELPFTIKLPLCALEKQPSIRIVFNTFSAYLGPLQLKLITTYVFLSDPERNYMKTHKIEYLCQGYQLLEFVIPVTETTFNINTEFVNNVKEMFWIIQDESPSDIYLYKDDLLSLGLTFNGLEYLSPHIANGRYLSSLQPLEYHTRTPTSNVYMYSFALQPESDDPTGEVNMSQINSQTHTLSVKPSATLRKIRIYAHSYNIAYVENGGLTMLHASMNSTGFKN